MHYLFCSKSFILPWNFVFLQKELTLSFGVNYVFLRRRQVKVQKVRSWGWFTMLNPISKSFRQCLIQNDFANITMKCRICNNEEKCLLCCFGPGLCIQCILYIHFYYRKLWLDFIIIGTMTHWIWNLIAMNFARATSIYYQQLLFNLSEYLWSIRFVFRWIESWLVFLCSALFFGHWMHIKMYLIIIPVWNE